MEKFQSLADALGVPDPKQPERAAAPRVRNQTIKDFCKGVLASEDYRLSILQRITLGTLPPAIETLLYHYAEGKPVEKVEFKDKTNPLEDMTAAQLEQRAMQLVQLARRLREDEASGDESDEESTHVAPQETRH